MRKFHLKLLRIVFPTLFFLGAGLWFVLASLDAALAGSFWGKLSFGQREYPIPLIFFLGAVGMLLGGVMGQALLSHSAFVSVGPEGLHVSPMMRAPLPWSKIDSIEVLRANRSRFLRKGAIIVSVTDPSDIPYSDFLARIMNWSPGRVRKVTIVPSSLLGGDRVCEEIARYFKEIS